jgi:hypothetical protein
MANNYSVGTQLANLVSPIPLITQTPGLVTPEEQVVQTVKSTAMITLMLVLGRKALQSEPLRKVIQPKAYHTDTLRSQLALRAPILDITPLKADTKDQEALRGLGENVKLLEEKEAAGFVQGIIDRGRARTEERNAPVEPPVPVDPAPTKTSLYDTLKQAFTSQKGIVLTTLAIAAPALFAVHRFSNLNKDLVRDEVARQKKKIADLDNELNAMYYSELKRVKGGDEEEKEAEEKPAKLPFGYATGKAIAESFTGAQPREHGFTSQVVEGGKTLYALYAALIAIGAYKLSDKYLEKRDPNTERKNQLNMVMAERSKVKEGPQFVLPPNSDIAKLSPMKHSAPSKSLKRVQMADAEALTGLREKLLDAQLEEQSIDI